MKKALSILLALLMLTPAFLSCSDSTGSDETTSSANPNVSEEISVPEETEITRRNMPDNLPKKLDFEGASIFCLHAGGEKAIKELYVEEDTGDALDSAIFARNMAVEERLNIKIAPVEGDPAANASTAVTAGLDEYQTVGGSQWTMMKQATQGLYYNIYEMKYIDTDQPWWAKKFIEAATIGKNRLYYLTGDAAVSLLMNMGVLFVNNTLYENIYGSVNSLYDTVLAGEWTFDLMARDVEGVYIDVNGDGVKNKDDVYGFSSTTLSMLDYIVGGAALRFCDYDDNGYPSLCINNERSVSFNEALYRLMYENTGTLIADPSVEGENMAINKFSSDTVMFLPFRADGSNVFRDMESDYAILPHPKFDETQTTYSTAVHDSVTTLAIPITNTEKLDATCAFLEAFAAESYRTVTDVYFSTLLKEKFARDQTAASIFDIILDGIYFDFALLHSYALNSVGQIFRTTITNKNSDFASTYQKNAKMYDKLMKKLIEAYQTEQ